ncbi:AAA ATPase [Desulfovibrio sp. X2]|uniref:ATP-binding cassette domain-containing protein n=1 Tax=Desulfovibrio sp. X2 TaxID=941449 RepID=UPI000358D991|nr:ATP-binding cassette domain-containing protein [Desulfovibrio sp. X2]EPR37030.1 AAA ATPase [Desulfovibrio sp. X2]
MSPASALPYADTPCGELIAARPHVKDFLASVGVAAPRPDLPLGALLAGLDEDELADLGVEKADLPGLFADFMESMEKIAEPGEERVRSVTVRGGHDKSGAAEALDLTLAPGDVVCIVGPTGSGKSRFLADIEWLAQGDTPTGRSVFLNGRAPDPGLRFSAQRKLVAQLSQNMNFVMDLGVREFLSLHAESRMIGEPERAVEAIIALGNELAGESFGPHTPLTSLSGGQSRALMIADTALLSVSPIVLIDEIENAGIDRRKALRLLTDEKKIVLMATHDPILALLGDRRLVFGNGAVRAVIETSGREREMLAAFEDMDRRLSAVRDALRAGQRLDRTTF